MRLIEFEGRERFHVELQPVRAVEHDADLVADRLLERAHGHALLLRLAGADEACRIGDRGLQGLSGEVKEGGLESAEHQPDEGEGEQTELDRGGTVLVTPEAHARSLQALNEARQIHDGFIVDQAVATMASARLVDFLNIQT